MDEKSQRPIPFLGGINWKRPIESEYFRNAGGYLALRFAILAVCGLASQYLLTHNLDVDDYGLIIWVGTIAGMLSFFGLPGITTSITGAVARGFDDNFRRGTYYQIIGGTLGGVVLLGFASYYRFWVGSDIKALIFAAAGVLGPGFWLDTHLSYWNGKKNFRAIFWWSVPVRILQLLAVAAVLLFSTNPALVFFVQTVIQVAANIGTSFAIIHYGDINRKQSDHYQSYGWYYSFLHVLGLIATYFDKLFIGIFYGLENLAVFSVGELIYSYIYKTPFGIIGQVFMPRLAEMEKNTAAKWIWKRMPFVIAATFAAVVIVGLAIPVVYPLLFSTKYIDSIYYAYLFLGCIMLGSPVILTDSLIKSHAMKKENTILWMIFVITPLITLPIFGMLWGLSGLVLSRGFTNLMGSIYLVYLTRKIADS